jgi:hypothetical protein
VSSGASPRPPDQAISGEYRSDQDPVSPRGAWYSDAWDGYAADRDRILRFLWERQPANPIVLTGDIHFFESRLRGYTRRAVIRERWYADLRVVDTSSGAAPLSGPSPPTSWRTTGQGGTGLEWRALTTTYGGAWVRP